VGKLVLYRPSEQPFDLGNVRAALSRVPGGSFRTEALPGSLLWLDVRDATAAIAVRLNETSNGLWIDSDDAAGFRIASVVLASLGEELMLADLQGNWVKAAPGMDSAQLQQSLDEQ
jgi:hypothetical protein